MRSFDIPGAGGIMLAPKTNDHEKYFVENEDVFLYESVEIAFHKANQILNFSFEKRLEIRKSARDRALKFHTYMHRTDQLIKLLES
jgi:spore maturation protein CgeB